jgi:hypothetical protein
LVDHQIVDSITPLVREEIKKQFEIIIDTNREHDFYRLIKGSKSGYIGEEFTHEDLITYQSELIKDNKIKNKPLSNREIAYYLELFSNCFLIKKEKNKYRLNTISPMNGG